MSTSNVDLKAKLYTLLIVSALSRISAIRQPSSLLGLYQSEVLEKYREAVADIEHIEIADLDDVHGAFRVVGGRLVISESAVSRILFAVLDHIRNERVPLLVDELHLLYCDLFTIFVLHEIRHRTQGVEDYGVVQRLKLAAGRSAMAELDVLADRDAAWTFAVLQNKGGSRAAFLTYYREALVHSLNYFFSAFPFDGSRRDKVERAVGIVLMIARLAQDFAVTEIPKESSRLPLDAPIVVALSADLTKMAVYRSEPSKELLGVGDFGQDVGQLTASLIAGKYDAAISHGVKIVRDLRLA